MVTAGSATVDVSPETVATAPHDLTDSDAAEILAQSKKRISPADAKKARELAKEVAARSYLTEGEALIQITRVLSAGRTGNELRPIIAAMVDVGADAKDPLVGCALFIGSAVAMPGDRGLASLGDLSALDDLGVDDTAILEALAKKLHVDPVLVRGKILMGEVSPTTFLEAVLAVVRSTLDDGAPLGTHGTSRKRTPSD